MDVIGRRICEFDGHITLVVKQLAYFGGVSRWVYLGGLVEQSAFAVSDVETPDAFGIGNEIHFLVWFALYSVDAEWGVGHVCSYA